MFHGLLGGCGGLLCRLRSSGVLMVCLAVLDVGFGWFVAVGFLGLLS